MNLKFETFDFTSVSPLMLHGSWLEELFTAASSAPRMNSQNQTKISLEIFKKISFVFDACPPGRL